MAPGLRIRRFVIFCLTTTSSTMESRRYGTRVSNAEKHPGAIAMPDKPRRSKTDMDAARKEKADSQEAQLQRHNDFLAGVTEMQAKLTIPTPSASSTSGTSTISCTVVESIGLMGRKASRARIGRRQFVKHRRQRQGGVSSFQSVHKTSCT